jgi:regulator of sirC expression with transglutaminase-like and TPR domain
MAIDELRDRGLLASHLDDFPRALRDLEAWLQHVSRVPGDEDTRKESEQVWEHVKGLRKRIAGLN